MYSVDIWRFHTLWFSDLKSTFFDVLPICKKHQQKKNIRLSVNVKHFASNDTIISDLHLVVCPPSYLAQTKLCNLVCNAVHIKIYEQQNWTLKISFVKLIL